MELVTQAELARLIGVSRQRTCQLMQDPEFPAARRERFYDLGEIRSFLRRRALMRLERHGVLRPDETPRFCLHCGAAL